MAGWTEEIVWIKTDDGVTYPLDLSTSREELPLGSRVSVRGLFLDTDLQTLHVDTVTPVSADDKTPPGVLRHGSSTRPSDVSLVYGNYYLLEDLIWLDEHGSRRQ